MPDSTFPRDRFDDVPDDGARIGAHRAENPHLRGWAVFLWAAVATVVLIALGIFGTLIASGKIVLFPTPEPTVTAIPTASAVVDTSYSVVVLNATPVTGLATTTKDAIVAAGWSADAVIASQAATQDFPTTTVYYYLPEDEGAAWGLAEVVGAADVAQSDVYQPVDDPNTPDDEAQTQQLVVVIGLDRAETATPESAP